MDISEIAATTARDPDFLGDPPGMIKHQHITVARPSRQRAHQSAAPAPITTTSLFSAGITTIQQPQIWRRLYGIGA